MTSYLERDGVRLAYEEAGTGGPPVVLLHGFACDRRFSAKQFDALRGARRVVSIDFRGHGESDAPTGDDQYTVGALADDVAWMCGELGVHRPVVIGHSLGGQVALEMAARVPEGLAAVVALDATIVPPEGAHGFLQPFTDALRTPGYAGAVAQFMALSFAPFDDPEMKAWVIEATSSIRQHVALPLWEDGMYGWDGAAAASACRVPFLYVDHGAPNCDLGRLRALCPALLTAQTVGSGHFAPLLVPDQVNAMIDGFFRVVASMVPATG